MKSIGFSCASVVLAQLALLLSVFALDLVSSDETSEVQNSRQKRSGLDLDRLSEKDLVRALNKRAPGWGKRYAELVPDDELMEEKRAPGWGKRSSSLEEEKRGWGKRAPGWGKRAPGWGKRAPGWGKRAPGWGKRAPGWGKRAGDLEGCWKLDRLLDELNIKAEQVMARKIAECGADDDADRK